MKATLSGWVLVLALSAATVHAQQNPPAVGEWRVVTDLRGACSVSASLSGAWVATTGGLYRRSAVTGEFEIATVANGLPSNDLSAMVGTPDGDLLLGSEEGYVTFRSAETGAYSTVSDIALSGRIQKGVRSFLVDGDSVFIGSDFGISVFLKSRNEFGDTYGNFGFAATASVQRIMIHNERIWVATTEGVATAMRSAPNLSAPTSWTTYGAAEGLPSKNALSLGVLSDTIIVGTSNGLAYYNGSGFQSIGQAQGAQIVDMQGTSPGLTLLWNQGGVLSVGTLSSTGGPLTLVATSSGTGNGLSLDPDDGSLWVATDAQGAIHWVGSIWEEVLPNGPASSLFISLALDASGVLWCGSGANTSGKGFYRFDPSLARHEQWKNFQQSQYPIMATNDYYKVSTGSNGRMWISSWGRGVIEIVSDTIRRIINSTTIPKLMGAVPSDPSFVVAGSVAEGADATEWVVARSAVDGNYIAHLVSESTFVYYTNSLTPTEGEFTAMVIDENGTKWLANAEPFNKPGSGLYYFNEQKIIPGTELTGGWGLVTDSDGLPNMTVLSLAVDRDGEVWVGTDLGVMIITDPFYPKQRNIRSFPLREQIIQAIAVDGVNNKWIGTKEGIFLVSPDGTQLLSQYTVTSTGGKLLSNDVRALAINQKNGILYVGTEKGLSILGIAPVGTERSYSTLDVAPNPFFPPQHQMLVIRNLVPESSIKILSVDGSVVSEFRAQGGGRAFWDGRDRNGELVSTGVYFVVAYADDGNQIITQKVAVVRQ